MVPEGTSSITAEVSFSATKQVDHRKIGQKVVDDLMSAGILGRQDKILAMDVTNLEPAYVVYNHSHSDDVKQIRNFLKSEAIYVCGRFGEWEYLNMDQAILSGKRAAAWTSRDRHSYGNG